MRMNDIRRLTWLDKQKRLELYSVDGEFLIRSHNKYKWVKGIRKAIDLAFESTPKQKSGGKHG